MRLRRVLWFCAMLLIALPPLCAFQEGQSAGSPAAAEKKAKKKVKVADGAGEAAGESPASAAPGEKPAETPKRKAGTEASGSAQRALPTVSASDIEAAKTSGKVWVNTQTGVYHKGGKWYGATKQGKFMSEQEAVQAGYRAFKSR